MKRQDSDVLVLGSGIGGLFLALSVADHARVTIVTKKQDSDSNTNWAQGGIAAVLGPGDSFARHVKDTLEAGAGLCHPDVVREVVRQGPGAVRELVELGARFTREGEDFELGREGGHSARRIVHARDQTGREIERALLAAAGRHPNITLHENHVAVDLLLESHLARASRRAARAAGGTRRAKDAVWGAYVLERTTGRIRPFRARATVLATGGSGKVYLYTTNPDIATGDGVAMAWRAGAPVANLEFVQFHPTCLYHPRAKSFLISEAVRGEGAVLLSLDGERFMAKVHPLKDLAPRDIVARAIDAVLSHKNVRLREDHLALELAVAPDRQGRRSVWGATVLDRRTGRTLHVRARATVLATGGSGKVYLYTTNPDIATGDGVAMAYRAGATVANLEFVQFHPTSLYHPQAGSFLISEAVRGEGALLTTVDGHRFMPAVHELAELAPRDIVARAMDREMKRRGDKFVYLDLRPIGRTRIERRFPNIVARCRALGYDPVRDPLPVVPAAHYQCGGVRTDLFGRTDLRGLFAIGEVAMTGLHGANRLASNSLLEAVVFAHRAVEPLSRLLASRGDPPPARPYRHAGREPLIEAATMAHDWESVRRTMWDLVGIVRSDERLEAAASALEHLAHDVERVWRRHKVGADLVELRNLALVARLIVASAQRRKESRGLHFNLDHPRPLARYRRDTVLRRRPGLAAPAAAR